MPAIPSLEDLKAAQKEGVSIYAMLYAVLLVVVTGTHPRTIEGGGRMRNSEGATGVNNT